MNVYDCANELAKAMRESQEYKKLKEAKAALEQDPKGKEMACLLYTSDAADEL